MEFDNTNKRDILIIVNFPNIAKIKEITKNILEIYKENNNITLILTN